jgi:hypothetical protein
VTYPSCIPAPISHNHKSKRKATSKPPAYPDIPLQDFPPAPQAEEELPGYSPPAWLVRAQKPPFKRLQRRIFCFALGLIVLAIVLGVTVGWKLRASKASPPLGGADAEPVVFALAAAECESVSLVLYKDYQNWIYVRGFLNNGSIWPNTNSSQIPAMKIPVPMETTLSPMPWSNLTAVCLSSKNGTNEVVYFPFLFAIENYA